ncbi:hypothetical protein DINM_006020 [Dirofilaria immitis]|nr:hypothetical protein [Dirofilaria immitis]
MLHFLILWGDTVCHGDDSSDDIVEYLNNNIVGTSRITSSLPITLAVKDCCNDEENIALTSTRREELSRNQYQATNLKKGMKTMTSLIINGFIGAKELLGPINLVRARGGDKRGDILYSSQKVSIAVADIGRMSSRQYFLSLLSHAFLTQYSFGLFLEEGSSSGFCTNFLIDFLSPLLSWMVESVMDCVGHVIYPP